MLFDLYVKFSFGTFLQPWTITSRMKSYEQDLLHEISVKHLSCNSYWFLWLHQKGDFLKRNLLDENRCDLQNWRECEKWFKNKSQRVGMSNFVNLEKFYNKNWKEAFIVSVLSTVECIYNTLYLGSITNNSKKFKVKTTAVGFNMTPFW